MAKRLSLAALLAGVLTLTGCCKMCHWWCDPPANRGCGAPPMHAGCHYQPICCQPAYPPGTTPVPAVHAPPPSWSRPAFTGPADGCCYP